MKFRLLSISVFIIFLALALASGFILLWRLLFLGVLLLLLAYLWVFLSIRGIVAQVQSPAERLQVGDWFDEVVTVFNRTKLPKFLIEVEEISDLPGHHNVAAFNLSPNSSFCWRTKVYCQRRGRYSLGLLTATASDPLSLFSLRRSLSKPQDIIIYPPTLDMPFHLPLTPSTSVRGTSTWFMSEVAPSAARVREYSTSDSLSHIHWRSTAHTGRLMVKVFDVDRANYADKPNKSSYIPKLGYTPDNIWILVDMHQAVHLGNDDKSTEEYGITIAASLAKKYIDGGSAVGLMALGDRFYLFPPQGGDQHLWLMLEALALIKATGKVPVERLISGEIGHFGFNSVVIVITPSSSKQITDSLRQVANQGNIPVAVLLDPLSFGGTASSINVANGLASSGIEAYVVSEEEELANAYNSRVRSLPLRLTEPGDKI